MKKLLISNLRADKQNYLLDIQFVKQEKNFVENKKKREPIYPKWK